MRTTTLTAIGSSVAPSPSTMSVGRVVAVGQGGDHRPRLCLARGEEQPERLVERRRSVLRHRLEDAALGDADRGELGIDVAERELRQAHVLRDDADDVVDQPVVAGQADAGEAQALLVDRRRVGRDAAGDRAADIEEMGDGDAIGDQRAAAKIGRMIAKSQACVPPSNGIVGEEGVAGAHVGAEALDMNCTCREKVPVKMVMPLVWATRSPRASQMPQAKSSTS